MRFASLGADSALIHSNRQDARELDQVRDVTGVSPCLPPFVHGSALFTRGETQVLSTVTLGSPLETLDIRNPYAPR